jgi:hypothetical protein
MPGSRRPASVLRSIASPWSSLCNTASAVTAIAGTRTAGMVPAGIGAGTATVAAWAGAAEKDGTAGGIAKVTKGRPSGPPRLFSLSPDRRQSLPTDSRR